MSRVSKINGVLVTDTFVTGFTYTSSANTLTISNNDGSSYSQSINEFSGLTINSGLTANTLTLLTINTGTTSNNVLSYNDITNRIERIDNVNFGNIDGGTASSILLDLNINAGGA